MNHPNRSKKNSTIASTPSPADIRAAREAVGLTQTEAAEAIHSTLRTWQDWESDGKSHRRMHPGLFELFLITTGQAPARHVKPQPAE